MVIRKTQYWHIQINPKKKHFKMGQWLHLGVGAKNVLPNANYIRSVLVKNIFLTWQQILVICEFMQFEMKCNECCPVKQKFSKIAFSLANKKRKTKRVANYSLVVKNPFPLSDFNLSGNQIQSIVTLNYKHRKVKSCHTLWETV